MICSGGQEVYRSVFTVTAQILDATRSQQSFEGKQFTESGGIGNLGNLA